MLLFSQNCVFAGFETVAEIHAVPQQNHRSYGSLSVTSPAVESSPITRNIDSRDATHGDAVVLSAPDATVTDSSQCRA
jgi:hypothetical protein